MLLHQDRTAVHDAEPKRHPASHTPGQVARLSFTGDVCLGKGVLGAHPDSTAGEILSGLPRLFAGSDLVVGNLEFAAIPNQSWSQPRAGAIAVEPHLLEGLGKSGFHVFSLANNHVMDAGTAGLRAMREVLRRQGLEWLGAGEQHDEAVRPLVLHVQGLRVGLLAACDWSPYFARSDRAGIAPLQASALLKRVQAVRASCDLVVVLLHADLEFTPHPAPWRQRLGRALVEHGAHAVIQHHPHVIQGWERHRGGVIAYSLGNFVFRIHGNAYQAPQPGTLDGLVLHLDAQFTPDSVRLEPRFVPVRIGTDHLPSLLAEPECERVLASLARLSAELREPRRVREAWRRRTTAEVHRVAYAVYADVMRGRLARALRAPCQVLLHPEDRRWLWGFLTAGYR